MAHLVAECFVLLNLDGVGDTDYSEQHFARRFELYDLPPAFVQPRNFFVDEKFLEHHARSQVHGSHPSNSFGDTFKISHSETSTDKDGSIRPLS